MSDSPKLFDSVKRLGGSGVGLLASRLRLLGIELAEEKERIVALLIMAVAAALFGVFGVVVLSMAVVFAVAEQHRLLAFACVGGAYIVLAALLLVVAYQRMRQHPGVFDATLRELERDRQILSSDQATSNPMTSSKP